MGECVLCGREADLQEHHLIPRSRKGKITTSVCDDCHKQIHALFDCKTLETTMNSVGALTSNENVLKFVKWVAKRPIGHRYKTKRTKETKKRGRRG